MLARKTPRRRWGRLGMKIGMVAGVIVAIIGLMAFFIVDTGALETDIGELTELRVLADSDGAQWLGGQVAWLRIDGTHIDYPVMQAGDNRWYLSHDFLNREETMGAIFLDYRNDDDFSDDVSIIYGHRMNGNLMFSDVAKYADSKYFFEHKNGKLYLRNGKSMQLTAVAYLQIDADDELYQDLVIDDYDSVVVLSTCDRAVHEKRDVLILRKE